MENDDSRGSSYKEEANLIKNRILEGNSSYETMSEIFAACVDQERRDTSIPGFYFMIALKDLDKDMKADGDLVSDPVSEKFIINTLRAGGQDLQTLEEGLKGSFYTEELYSIDSNRNIKGITDSLMSTEFLKTAHQRLKIDGPVEDHTWYGVDSLSTTYGLEQREGRTFGFGATPETRVPHYVGAVEKYEANSVPGVDHLANYSKERQDRIQDYAQDERSKNPQFPRPLMPGALAMRVENLTYLAEAGVIKKENIQTPEFVANVFLAVGEVAKNVDSFKLVLQDEDKDMANASFYFKRLDIDPNVTNEKGQNALHILAGRNGEDPFCRSERTEDLLPRFQRLAIRHAVDSGVSLDTEDQYKVSPALLLLKEDIYDYDSSEHDLVKNPSRVKREPVMKIEDADKTEGSKEDDKEALRISNRNSIVRKAAQDSFENDSKAASIVVVLPKKSGEDIR